MNLPTNDRETLMKISAVGLLVAISTTSAMAQDAKPATRSNPPPQMLQTEGGRFVFGQISEYRRDQFMLDTRSGRLWRIVMVKVGKPGEEQEIQLLEAVRYVGPDDKWYLDPR
jgi:hypothetical protein